MVKVTVFKDRYHHYRGYRFSGHAGYAQAGEDIVCSAVSVLAFNTCNAIEAIAGDKAAAAQDEEAGLLEVQFPEGLSHDGSILMDAMVLGLRSVRQSYSEFIQFEIEEV